MKRLDDKFVAPTEDPSLIPLFKVFMSDTAAPAASEVLNSGYVGQGPKVEEFEQRLRRRFAHDFVLTVNSCTSALHLALHLIKDKHIQTECGAIVSSQWPGLEDGDEVLATPLTCTASNWPILANNLNIKWVDVDPNTMNMDLDDLARKIGPKTKAILLVHWGGYPCDLDRVKKIQQQAKDMFGIKPVVIEDCAHSFGSEYKGKPLGTHGNICAFSFQAIKHFTTVDGGALFLPYQENYKRAKLLRWYGIDRENNRKDFRCEADIMEWGFKFHMNDLNAAIGIENLKTIDGVLDRHIDNANYYNQNLKEIPGVDLIEPSLDVKSSYWIYTMKVEDKDSFTKMMLDRGISVSRVHERNDKHTCVRDYLCQLPALDKLVDEMICIPNGWWITDEQREYIVDSIKSGW